MYRYPVVREKGDLKIIDKNGNKVLDCNKYRAVSNPGQGLFFAYIDMDCYLINVKGEVLKKWTNGHLDTLDTSLMIDTDIWTATNIIQFLCKFWTCLLYTSRLGHHHRPGKVALPVHLAVTDHIGAAHAEPLLHEHRQVRPAEMCIRDRGERT